MQALVKSDPHAYLCCSKRAGRKKPFPQSVHLKGRIFMWTAFLWTVKLPLLLNTFPHPASPQVTCSSWSFTNHLCNIWLGLDQLAQKLKICCCLTCACSLRAPVEWKLGRKLRRRQGSISSKNLVFYKGWYLRFEFFISRVNVVFYKKG